ncbi:type II secretion system F family protein [Rothia nasimurium]|uniref:type II secretion system F family protein n=1 Tax=Rothia nasimurium TaxID=85336 RepID=UPI003B9F9C16
MSICCLVAALGLAVVRARNRKKQPPGQVCPKREQEAKPVDEGLPGALYLDLTATLLASGQSVPSALQMLGELDAGRHRRYLGAVVTKLVAGANWEQAWGKDVPQDLAGVKDALGLTLATGAPGAQLVSALAERHRRHRQRSYEKSAATLAVKLVVPLGICSLPAFICLGVIPVLIALLPALF